MADRVRFATTNDTGTLANSSGFNGFPGPSIYGSPSGQFPIATGFTTAIKWYWRVKTWTVTITIEIENTTLGITKDFSTLDLSGSVAATTELDLIYGGGFSSSDTTVDAGGTFDISGPNVNDDAGDIRGLFELALGDVTGFSQFNSDASLIAGGWASTGSIACSVDGIVFSLYYGLDTDFTVSGNVVITASAFWPYAALDASPIYNTTTGAQLQSPLN